MTTDNIYIGGNEFIFSESKNGQSGGGGFSVNDIMKKSNISPVLSVNFNNMQTGGNANNKVSDLFHNLAVPNWATKYNMTGGEYKENDRDKNENENDSDSDIDDDLHDKLLGLVQEHETKVKQKHNKTKRKRKQQDKSITRKNKKEKTGKIQH